MRKRDAIRCGILLAVMSVSFSLLSWPLVGQDKELLKPTRVADGPPKWLGRYPFKKKFTFVRLRYNQPPKRWATDYPDADINLSNRLKQVTKLDVSPENLVLDPVDVRLGDYPFTYLSVNGIWTLSDPQVTALRKYLENGGFLMIDDSWGEAEQQNVLSQMKKVLPNRTPKELPLQHKIFHCVYDLTEKPQVYSIHDAIAGRDKGVTREREDGWDVSYQGVTNDSGRLMVLICHNTDLADGWEHVNTDAWYAREFSEKRAFPMAINTVFYALTASD